MPLIDQLDIQWVEEVAAEGLHADSAALAALCSKLP